MGPLLSVIKWADWDPSVYKPLWIGWLTVHQTLKKIYQVELGFLRVMNNKGVKA